MMLDHPEGRLSLDRLNRVWPGKWRAKRVGFGWAYIADDINGHRVSVRASSSIVDAEQDVYESGFSIAIMKRDTFDGRAPSIYFTTLPIDLIERVTR